MEPIKEAAARTQPETRLPEENKNKGKKIWLVPAALLAALAVLYIGLCAFAASRDTIYPNRAMRGIPVGGLTTAQAAEALAEAFPQQTFTIEVCLTDPDSDRSTEVLQTLTLPYGDLGATLDYDLAARVAAGEWPLDSRNFFADGWDYLLSCLGRSDKGSFMSLDIDDAAFESGWNALLSQITAEAQDASYTLEGGTLTVTTAKDGLRLSTHPEMADQAAVLRSHLMVAHTGNIHLETLPARPLTAQEIYNDLHDEMRNASYDAATGTILPEHLGVDFDITAAQAALDAAAPGEAVTLNAVIEAPQVTAAQLEKVLFRDVLGETRTHVSGTAGRIGNVKLSAAAINGYVMNSGDVFSYNEALGKRTAAKGYQPAPAYIRGETVDEIGGGICQTTSTLYLACLLADLEITERYAHRFVPAYISWGMDATVSWGGPDYKFTNNTLYPIKIVTEYANNYLTVKILGTNTDGSYAKMTNKTLSTTPWETVYEEDPTMLPGSAPVVKTTPYTGYKVETYHTIYNADGTVRSSHFEATSNYKVRNKVILVAPGELPGAAPVSPAIGEAELPMAPATETPDETAPSLITPPAEEADTPTDTAEPEPEMPAEV